MRKHHSTNNRHGFTLTEMLVATALMLFIMAIISAAYRAGLDTFSKLNTANQLQQKLTNAHKIISRDLGADHFDGPYIDNRSGPKLSDQRLDLPGWRPPAGGYFWLYQGADAVHEAGGNRHNDGEGLGSSRQTLNAFSFTLRNPSTEYVDQFAGRIVVHPTAPSPPGTQGVPPYVINNTCFSPWAQAHYFLQPTGTFTEPVNGQRLELYSLRRQLWLLAPDDGNYVIPVDMNDPNPLRGLRVTTAGVTPSGNSAYTNVRLLKLSEVQFPTARCVQPDAPLNPTPAPVAGNGLYPVSMFGAGQTPIAATDGSDILMVNVISFEVKALWSALQWPQQWQYQLVGMPAPVVVNVNGGYNTNPSLLYSRRPTAYVNYANTTTRDFNYEPPLAPGNFPMPWRDSREFTGHIRPGSDWPYNDLPHNGADGISTTARQFDTWFRSGTNEPNWDNYPYHPVGPVLFPDGVPPGLIPNWQAINANQPPLRIRISALQIKIRIWDQKTKTARQITFVQEV